MHIYYKLDHVIFTIEQVVNDLDDNHFQVFYHHFGRPSYHPKMLLSALLFAYSQGVFSGRKIEKLMVENLAMQHLTRQLAVSYRTINRFRVAAGMENLICDLFIELNLRLKMAELVTQFAQLLEEELAELNQAIEERPVMGKDERKTKRRKLKKVLHKVKDDFSVRAEKYETYQSTFAGRKSFSKTDTCDLHAERNRLRRDDFFTSLKIEKRVI